MGVQVRGDIDNRNFIMKTYPAKRQDAGIIIQDAGRATVLAPFTLMSKISVSGKWDTFTTVTATDGTAIPQGIFMGDEITAAALVAGDVVDQPILESGAEFDSAKLVIENSLTLDTIIPVSDAANVYSKKTVGDYLRDKTLIPVDTISISNQENT